jgi:low temperature requirement protein LtrA
MCSTRKHRRHQLTLPLALNAALFAVVAAFFGGMFGAFSVLEANITGILIAVYVVLTVEFFGTLAISIAWRRVSFRATHIGERLGLLGLIIIGEGAST